MDRLIELTAEMISYDRGEPRRIQHFLKVHSLARLIGEQECLEKPVLYTLETAALVHDIGIRPAEEKYGRCDGPLQEKEGMAPARELLTRLGFPRGIIERVVYLVGHHHTYSQVEGLDYQILLEADFLVNLYEASSSREAIEAALEKIFRTPSGICLCRTMFGL